MARDDKVQVTVIGSSASPFTLSPPPTHIPPAMPRKAAPPHSTDAPAEPRRSSRIKEQPKAEAPPKKAAKPRAKKVKPVDEKEDEAKESLDEIVEDSKPKSARGRKRTAVDKDAEKPAEPAEPAEPAAAEEEDAPPSKKVRPVSLVCRRSGGLSVVVA